MRKKNFTSVFAIALFLIAGMNSHAADDTRHLIVMNLDSVQIASFSTEYSLPPVIEGNKVVIKNTWSNEPYKYDMATTLFTFDMRPRGSATGNEEINIQKWGVSYSYGTLHIINPVGPVAIYNYQGGMIGRFPNKAEISVNLPRGHYIVTSGNNNSVKLFVNTNGYGGANTKNTQSQLQTKSTYATDYSPLFLRSDVVEGDYWNVTNGKMTIPIDLSQVKVFKFIPDANMSLEYKTGNKVEITNYVGGSYDAEPAQTNTYWNMEESMLYGGVSYTMDLDNGGVWDIVAVGLTYKDIIGRSVAGKVNESVARTKIVQPNFISSKLCWSYKNNGVYVLSRYAPISVGGLDWIGFHYYDDTRVTPGEAHLRTRVRVYDFNEGTPEIPFTARIEGYNLVYSFVDVVSGEPKEIWLTP